MGGPGSGTWCRWNKKRTCEYAKRLDIRDMRKSGSLRPGVAGTWSWSRGGEPAGGDEMFAARCEHFPALAMAEGSPQRAYDGLMAMIEKVWAVKVGQGEMR
jgi:hypothetical protein